MKRERDELLHLEQSRSPRADQHPRFVKIVRTRIARFLGTSKVVYAPATSEQLVRGLRAKLVEEAIEYLQDPNIGELADVLEVVRALAHHDLGVNFRAVEIEAVAKADERGGFNEGMAMFVYSTASARHESEHAT